MSTGPVLVDTTTKRMVSPTALGTPFTVAYDGSNYVTITVASNGVVTVNATGAGAGVTFSDNVTFGSEISGNPNFTGTVTGNGSLTFLTLEATTTLTGGSLVISGLMKNSGGIKRVTSNFDKTNNTLANITGLSVSVTSGQTYRFRAKLFTLLDAGGQKIAIAGTATATSIIYDALATDEAAVNPTFTSSATALGGTVGVIGGLGSVQINNIVEGTIVVNVGGTLTVQFAQSTTDAAASSVLAGSFFEVIGL